MPPRIGRRWQTRFGRFVQGYGVERLVDALGQHGSPVTPSAVYSWMSGAGTPRAERMSALVRISGGSVTPQAILDHRETVREQR